MGKSEKIGLVKNFDNDIKKLMELIKSDEKMAYKFFNEEVFKKYERYVRIKENPLVFFEIFFTQLDEYFNNDSAKILGAVNKKDLLKSYNSDYKEDLALALKKEYENE